MLVGANATGKTNIVEELIFIKRLIISSNKLWGDGDYEPCFRFTKTLYATHGVIVCVQAFHDFVQTCDVSVLGYINTPI